MFLRKRHLLFACVVAAILHAASVVTRRITPAHPAVPFAGEGSFTRDGQYPGEPFAHAVGVRAWGSWSGDDANTGSFTLGPFPAPRILRFGIGGYPNDPNNALHVGLAGTATRLPVPWGPVGERWQIVDFVLPADWVGRPIQLVGSDNAKGVGGWFAVTEPVRGGRGDGNNALLETLAAWSINGLLLGLVYCAALRWLIAHGSLASHWIPLGAGAIVALCGYLTFWIYFASALAGVIASWAVIVASLVFGLRRASAARIADPESPAEAATVLALLVAVGAFHLGVLHLFPTPHDFYTLAANRFRESLPSDNMLPHGLAERLFASLPARNPADEWQSSDRPPLQAGWQLLTWSAGKLLGLDRRTLSGTSAVWFQLLWVAGAYGLLRTFRIGRSRAAGWVAVLALAGFFVQNTTFTWPKLSAGAFACGAFAVLVLPSWTTSARANGFWSAGFAGLAWLSHGGVAFSFLPLVPWVAWRAVRGEWRAWLPGAAAALALVLPWIAYQKFYDPPGSMLLKLHLAGQDRQDARSVGETIRDRYAEIGGREAWANKVTNFHAQVFGRWSSVLDVSTATRVERRNEEFFHPGRALTWWPLLALPALALVRRRVLTPARDFGVFAGWMAATIVVWCLLMFGRYQAVVHHGSYALMIGLFVLFSVVLERSGRGWLAVIAILQAITLGTTWAVGNAVVHGPATGMPYLVTAAAFLAWFVLRATFAVVPSPDITPTPAPDVWERIAGRIRMWWQTPRLNLWVLAAIAALLALRKPHAWHTPQLWAEDGSIFLMQADLHGSAALTMPYMGYLHLLPRLIAWAAPRVLDPVWWPAFYNGISFAIWLAVLARLFTPRFSHLPGRPWLALALVAVPHTGEVYFNITNLQWLTACVLIQQALIVPPATTRSRVTDLLILALVALTGPFGLVFLPLFAWRAWRDRGGDTFAALAVVAAAAAVQAWFVVRTGPEFAFQAEPFRLWPALEVLARRLVVWPVLGRDLAFALPPAGVVAAGGGFLLALTAWIARPDPRRPLRLTALAALVLIVLAGVYRTRPDTWPGDNLDFADRYFHIPRVLLAWLLIWEFDATPRFVGSAARLACLAALVLHVHHFTLRAPKDYDWASRVEPIRQGIPADIPTLPENWTLKYQGRPQPDR